MARRPNPTQCAKGQFVAGAVPSYAFLSTQKTLPTMCTSYAGLRTVRDGKDTDIAGDTASG